MVGRDHGPGPGPGPGLESFPNFFPVRCLLLTRHADKSKYLEDEE